MYVCMYCREVVYNFVSRTTAFAWVGALRWCAPIDFGEYADRNRPTLCCSTAAIVTVREDSQRGVEGRVSPSDQQT